MLDCTLFVLGGSFNGKNLLKCGKCPKGPLKLFPHAFGFGRDPKDLGGDHKAGISNCALLMWSDNVLLVYIFI